MKERESQKKNGNNVNEKTTTEEHDEELYKFNS